MEMGDEKLQTPGHQILCTGADWSEYCVGGKAQLVELGERQRVPLISWAE